MSVVGLRESITLHSSAFASGEFYLNIIVIEDDGIISGFCNFIFVFERRTIFFRVKRRFTCDRGEAEVAVVVATSASEVGETEAENCAVGDVVS